MITQYKGHELESVNDITDLMLIDTFGSIWLVTNHGPAVTLDGCRGILRSRFEIAVTIRELVSVTEYDSYDFIIAYDLSKETDVAFFRNETEHMIACLKYPSIFFGV